MVIVRSSPQKAAPQSNQAWPPKSPLAALLSSPSGRKRYESRLRRESVSPSPVKRRRLNDAADENVMLDGTVASEEDEDEETLKLELAAIEARLKLKKLQNAKAKENRQDVSVDVHMGGTRGRSGSLDRGQAAPVEDERRPLHNPSRQQQSKVIIPVSPVRSRRLPSPESPARVLLGIDKGVRAQDVSLKRPATSRMSASASLQSTTGQSTPQNRPKSFAERIAASRTESREIGAKQERIKNARSHGFSASQQSASLTSTNSLVPAAETRISAVPDTSHTLVEDRDASTLESYTGFHLSKRHMDHSNLTRSLSGKELYSIPRLLKEVVGPEYEPPDCESDYVVFGIVAAKSTPLDHKAGPKTIDSAGSDAHTRSKFMVLKLTDLKWEIDLFLFDTGFDTFWKTAPGTVVAILNPGIMPPKNRATGAFSLKFASSEDTLIEIGTSKDLTFCSAIKSDGKQCTQWIDGRRTEVCEFHLALKVSKARKGRMELNTMVGGATRSSAGATRGQGRGGAAGRGAGRGGRGGRGRGLLPEGKTYDAALHEVMYLAPRELGFSATRLLDEADADVNAWQRGMSREEMQRRRARAKSKERELAARLGALGASAGSEYLRKASAPASAGAGARASLSAAVGDDGQAQTASFEEAPSAKELGLLDNKASDVVFAATSKRKRTTAGFSEPMGWGGARKSGLLLEEKHLKMRPAPGVDSGISTTSKIQSDMSPKKRARFMLAEKGIREPGRESLGDGITMEPVSTRAARDEDDSDDLEIV